MLHGDKTQLALTCSAGTASSHPEVRPGANSLGKEDSPYTHVWSVLPVKKSVSTRNLQSSATLQPGHRAAQIREGQNLSKRVRSLTALPPQQLLLAWPVWMLLGESAPVWPCSQKHWAPARRVCSHSEGRQLPGQGGTGLSQQSGESLLTSPPLCRAQYCRLPSCSCCEGSTPCLQHRLEHPQHTWTARAHLGSSAAPFFTLLPQHKARIYTSILLTCSQDNPWCNQAFFALTTFLQLSRSSRGSSPPLP